MALLGPITGTAADRFSRKTLMVISDIGRGVLILLLAFASSMWMVYICLFLIGMLSAVFVPAKNGKLKELVPSTSMKSAMSITSMIDAGTKVIGPLLSGLLVTLFGTSPVFYMDAATFFVSALLILALPGTTAVIAEKKKETTFKEEFKEGLSYISKSRYLLSGLGILGVSLLVLQLSDSQIIILIREMADATPNLFGIIVTSSGLGMLISGGILAKKTNYHALSLLLVGVLNLGLSFGVIAVLTSIELPLPILWGPFLGMTAGISIGLIFIPFQASVQTTTPVTMTGRVFGVINSVTTTATIIGPLLGGWLATIWGVIPTFIITSSLLVIIAVVGYLFRGRIERGNQIAADKHEAM
jgi:MFS family permease